MHGSVVITGGGTGGHLKVAKAFVQELSDRGVHCICIGSRNGQDKQWFDNAVEKIDSVLELLPYHLDPQKTPSEISEIIYKFDSESIRWRLFNASSENKKFSFTDESWKEIK